MHYHLLRKSARKQSGKRLTSARMSNPQPFAEQNGAQTVKAVDKRKNEQSANMGAEIWCLNRDESL